MPRTYGLGRVPSPPDERDLPLRTFLEGGDGLDAALASLEHSQWVAPSVKRWAKIVTQVLDDLAPSPPPAPPPTPTPGPSGAVSWADTDAVLDQGDTPHCVGFGSAQWGNTLPVDDHFTNADAHDLYYACKVVDGEPGAEDGSTARSAATVLRARNMLSTYAFAASVDEALAWVLGHGPVMAATDWRADMDHPDAQGVIEPTGALLGGHFYVMTGYDPASGLIEFLQSWGPWGLNDTGRFYMRKASFERLFASAGELVAAAELG